MGEQSKHSPSVKEYDAAGDAGPEQSVVAKSSWASEPPAAHVRGGAAARRRVVDMFAVIADFILYGPLRLKLKSRDL